jgi:radical SAM protein with 4Fe4S-binding SPASM domain
MVVSKKNISYIAETAKLLVEEYGVTRLSLSRVGKPVNAGASFDDLRLDAAEVRQLIEQTVEIHEKYGINVDASSPYPVCALESDAEFELLGGKRLCSAGKTSLVIGSDGGVKACPRDSHVYGNVFSEPFNIIWDRMNEWRTDELYPVECRDCNVFASCRGACRADALADAGDCKALDTAAKPERIPLSFKKKKTTFPKYGEEEQFCFLKDALVLEELEGYRLSHWGKYAFLSEKAIHFLQEHPVFSKKDLSDVVEENEKDAVISRLLSNGMIKHHENKTYN